MALWKYAENKWSKTTHRKSQQGKSAFIVCNGPSLNDIDINLLKGPGRVVIGVNNTYPKLSPDFWVGMDTPDCYDQALFAEAFPKVMRGTMTKESYNGQYLMDVPNVYFADVALGVKLWEEEKNDCFVWHNHTLGIAIQLALYLGCKEIVFVGVDLDNSEMHYADGNYLTPALAARNQLLHNQQLEFIKNLQEEGEDKGISFYTVSDKSKLSSFLEKVELVEYLEKTKASFPSGRQKKHVLEDSSECNEFKALLARNGKAYSPGHQAMYKGPAEFIKGVPADILEIGFGIGAGVQLLLDNNCIKSYVGCEPCNDSYNFTNQNIKDERVKLLPVGWSGLALNPKCVDFTFMIEVIEHIPKEEWYPLLITLKELTRKTLFLSTPDIRDTSHGVTNTDEMSAILKSIGFDVVFIRHQWTTMYICVPSA